VHIFSSIRLLGCEIFFRDIFVIFPALFTALLLPSCSPNSNTSEEQALTHNVAAALCKNVELCGYVVNSTNSPILVSVGKGEAPPSRVIKPNQVIVVDGKKVFKQDILSIKAFEDTTLKGSELRESDIDYVNINGVWKKIGAWCTKIVALDNGKVEQRWCSDFRD
jgi:hypothetical protein